MNLSKDPEGRPTVDPANLSRWLTGHLRPNPSKIPAVAEALQVPEAEALEAAGYLPEPRPAILSVNLRNEAEVVAVRAFLYALRGHSSVSITLEHSVTDLERQALGALE